MIDIAAVKKFTVNTRMIAKVANATMNPTAIRSFTNESMWEKNERD